MTTHLPECAVLRPADNYYGGACICPSLRACEQRVLEDEFSYKGDIDTAYGQGWDAALDAAREAVAALPRLTGVEAALAAIDTLRATD